MKHWKLFLLLGLGAFALWCAWHIAGWKRLNPGWGWTGAAQAFFLRLWDDVTG
jgi:hypothetical protein